MRKKTVFLVFLMLVASIVAGFELGAKRDGTSKSVENGKVLYMKYCSTCHGVDGTGEGSAAVYLNPKPRDLTRGIFKIQSTPSGSLPTDGDLKRTIRNGIPGSAMVAWDRLTDEQTTDLVNYIKTFSERFSTDNPSAPIDIGNPPESTPQLVQEGKIVYALAGCWRCHGKTGKGDGPSASQLMDDWGRPIPPYNFTRSRSFKGGGMPKDIYRTFSTGMSGTPMPAFGEDALTLTKESFADLTFFEDEFTKEEIEGMKKYVATMPTEKEAEKMTEHQRKAIADGRRWALANYVLSLSKSGKSHITYTMTDHSLRSVPVDDISQFADPSSVSWRSIDQVELALISLWQRDTPTDRVAVKSLTDGKSIAFRLEWDDPTKDDEALSNAKFGDAGAIQFPLDPATNPFFGMGDTSFAVNIWHWKSWWERDLQAYAGVTSAFPSNATDFYPFDVSGGSRAEYFVNEDSAKNLSMTWNAGWGSGNLLSVQTRRSTVEDVNAKGFGTLTSQPLNEQNVRGKGVWNNGKWSVVFIRTLDSPDKSDGHLKPGMTIPIAFAVWDGSLGDRNGQKMVTDWYKLTIEK